MNNQKRMGYNCALVLIGFAAFTCACDDDSSPSSDVTPMTNAGTEMMVAGMEMMNAGESSLAGMITAGTTISAGMERSAGEELAGMNIAGEDNGGEIPTAGSTAGEMVGGTDCSFGTL